MEMLIIVPCIILFLLLSLGLKFSLLLSSFCSLFLYISLSLLLSKDQKQIIEINEQDLTKKGKELIGKISKYQSLIENDTIKKNIKQICNLSSKILDTASSKKKSSSVKKFINYYLPFTLNILEQYNEIEDKGLSSKESKSFKEKVEVLTDKIKTACENTLNSLYEGDMINTNAEIKVFEGMLKSDGLVDDNMKIKIGSGKNG